MTGGYRPHSGSPFRNPGSTPPPPAALIELAPPDLSDGDLDGQDGWTSPGTLSLQMADFGGIRNFQGEDTAAAQSRNSHATPSIAGKSRLDLEVFFQLAADQGSTDHFFMLLYGPGVIRNFFVDLWYNPGGENFFINIGDEDGNTGDVLIDPIPSPGQWYRLNLVVTNSGEDFQVFIEGISQSTYHNPSPIPFADADTFDVFQDHSTGVNQWHGASLTLTATT